MNKQSKNDSISSILIVDDMPANLKLLDNILIEQGYIVRGAINGVLALNSVAHKKPDLILLDIRMPEMDGYEVCAKLKQNQQTCDIPIIFLSALDEPQFKVRAFEAGAVDYISKPFQVEEVLARVYTHLALAYSQKELIKAHDKLEEKVQQRTNELKDREEKNQFIIRVYGRGYLCYRYKRTLYYCQSGLCPTAGLSINSTTAGKKHAHSGACQTSGWQCFPH